MQKEKAKSDSLRLHDLDQSFRIQSIIDGINMAIFCIESPAARKSEPFGSEDPIY